MNHPDSQDSSKGEWFGPRERMMSIGAGPAPPRAEAMQRREQKASMVMTIVFFIIGLTVILSYEGARRPRSFGRKPRTSSSWASWSRRLSTSQLGRQPRPGPVLGSVLPAVARSRSTHCSARTAASSFRGLNNSGLATERFARALLGRTYVRFRPHGLG